MPTYEYLCADCGKTFEAFQKITDDPLDTCAHCGAKNVKRLVSAAAFHLKGGGWYKTDYASSGSSSSSGSTASTSGAADTSDKKTESKSAEPAKPDSAKSSSSE